MAVDNLIPKLNNL